MSDSTFASSGDSTYASGGRSGSRFSRAVHPSLAPATNPYASTSPVPSSRYGYGADPYGSDPSWQSPAPYTGAAVDGYGYPSSAPLSQVNVNVGGPTVVVADQATGPGLLVRGLWYLFVGWWLSAVVIVLGYALALTIVGIPLAFMVFSKVPQVTTLRPRTRKLAMTTQHGVTSIGYQHQEQASWLVRGLYFLFVGWWLGAIWLSLAWVIGLLIITLPITLMMYDRAPGVMTLHRH